MANTPEWDRRSSNWVEAQNASKRRKEQADKTGKEGRERRNYIAGNRP